MAFTVTNLVATTVDDGGSSTVSVGSQDFFADTLYLLAATATGNITPNVVGTSVTGGGLTWVKGNFKGSSLGRLEWWWCVPATDTTTALTVTYPEIVTAAAYTVDQIDGVDTVAPFIQGNEANGTTNAGVSGAALVSAALAVTYTSGSLLWACFGSTHNVTATPRSGWTESADYTSGSTTPGITVETQYRTTSATQASATFGASGQSYALVVEIRPGTTTRLRPDAPAATLVAPVPVLANDTVTIHAPGRQTWSDAAVTWSDEDALWAGGWMASDWTAQAPTLVASATPAPPAATSSWALLPPSVNNTITSVVVSFTFTPLAPLGVSNSIALDVSSAALTLAAMSPTVASGAQPGEQTEVYLENPRKTHADWVRSYARMER